MLVLNFCENYTFKLKKQSEKVFIYDCIRKRYYRLTPEEWVRQHVVQFLIQKKYLPITIHIEKIVVLNGLKKRVDILVYKQGRPFLLVECKAYNVQITQETFDQLARYNSVLAVEYLMVTNGLVHYYCKIDFDKKEYVFLTELPNF